MLAKLPRAEMDALRPHLEEVHLELHERLIKAGAPITRVYFPVSALASLVAVLDDGSTVEAGSVGREGMVGVPVVLDAASTPMETVTQVPGRAYRAASEVIKAEYLKRGTLHAVLNQYVHTLFVVASQSSACNSRHNVAQRLARWLLMSSDGVASDQVAITQEYLAVMLGVRRAGVTVAASKLQRQGVIKYSRGLVDIIDREGLERTACECYRIVKNEYDRLLG